MSQAGSDAGSNTKLRGEIVIDIDGDHVVSQGVKDLMDSRHSCQLLIHIKNRDQDNQPQTNQQDDSEDFYDPLDPNATWMLEIYKAARKGDWKTAKRIYKTRKLSFDDPITDRGETALHIAALADQIDFVRELVQVMSDNGLDHRDTDGNTALFFAVVSGKTALAEAMIEKKKGLVMARNKENELPIYAATLLGRKEMVSYLYRVSKHLLEHNDCANLLVALIDADMYDTALDMVMGGREWLATSKDRDQRTALHAFAPKPHFLANASSQVPSSRALSTCFLNQFWNLITSSKAQKNNLHGRARELAKYICDRVAQDDINTSELMGKYWSPIFVAAEHGNVEFLRMLIEKLPDVVFKRNEDGKTIFHVAVLFRRAEVFELLKEIGTFKYVISQYRDNEGNNLLHLAGELAPSDHLDAVPGAALQLQRELLWFQRVKKLVGPGLVGVKNNSKQTPDDVFMKNHKSLIKEGEEWMKKTADSCTIVAALVATVAFAATFTVPGGNDQNTGLPMYLNKASFKIFLGADAISLIFSVLSVLTFMSIQTSTYSLKDFAKSLPTKLLIGYSTLFISIAAMMVAFVAVFFVYFRQQHQLLSFALPVALVASAPTWLFIWLHYRLLYGMITFWRALNKIDSTSSKKD